jgi:TonB family protein
VDAHVDYQHDGHPHEPSPPTQSTGPTQDAETTYAPKPPIPRALLLKVGSYNLRLRFVIATDGSFQVMLITSSGIPELDQIALETCRTWRWKPALRDGVPCRRIVNQRIEFTVI